jgi:hypothetical protein
VGTSLEIWIKVKTSSDAHVAVSFYYKGGQRENTSENRGSETSLDHVDHCDLVFYLARQRIICLLAGSLPIKLMTLRSPFSIRTQFSFSLFKKALLDIFRYYHLRERICSVLDQY